MMRSLICSFACAGSLALSGQDIHFSQFFQVPLGANPANIGRFDGDQRVHAVFRQQWRSVTIPYRTFGFGGDLHDAGNVKGLGVGAWTYNDRAGDARLNTFHFSLGGSYTRPVDAAEQHWLGGGLQFGLTSLNIDVSDLRFDAQYNGSYYDPSLANGEQFQRDAMMHPDLQIGAIYSYVGGMRQQLDAGLAFYNLTQPKIGFFDSAPEALDGRTVFSVISQWPVNEKWDVLPMLQIMTQGKYSEVDLGGSARYIIMDRYGLFRAVRMGLYYRAADAGYVFAGIDHDDWRFGVSYDINLSDLVPASRNRGGIELTVVRIFKKRPLVPARFKACPDQL